ncbi:MAG: glycosyltransferase family 2 protein [Candidatus Omnitrophica bacterium]|nr:glycosyltransferase family 2 protein [Candidatus Omnitrophota bacterium]
MPLLSVIVPVFNEAKTVSEILDKIQSVDINKEIIVVDDGSSDETAKILRDVKLADLKVIHHSFNRGKGAAVLTGINNASGDFIVIQDADLEYDPNDYSKLMAAMKEENADIVLGARFTERYHGMFIPKVGNRVLTSIFNILFNSNLNDSFTCYKLFKRSTIQGFNLKSQSFNIEIEILAKALKRGLKIKEVPISYKPRDYKEGKKIRWFDGVHAIMNIIKYRFSE